MLIWVDRSFYWCRFCCVLWQGLLWLLDGGSSIGCCVWAIVMGSRGAAAMAVLRGVSDVHVPQPQGISDGHVPYDPTSALAVMRDASDWRAYAVDAPVSVDREGLFSPGGSFKANLAEMAQTD